MAHPLLAALPRVVVGSVSGAVQELTAADRALRMPLPLVRRIGVVQVRGGVGASTLAATVASTYAGRRSGLVLGVNASAGSRALGWHAGLEQSAPEDDPARARPRRAADAVAGLPRTPGGVHVLDLAAAGSSTSPTPAVGWFDAVGPIGRFFDVVVTDWGVRPAPLDLGLVAGSSHTVCVVARADRHSAEEAAAVVPAIRETEDRPHVVVALVDVGSTGEAAVADVLGDAGIPAIRVPFDRALGGTTPVGSRDLATGTRLALRRLATELLGTGREAS